MTKYSKENLQSNSLTESVCTAHAEKKGQLLPGKPCLARVGDKLQQYLTNSHFYYLHWMFRLTGK